uniref:NADH-ubiquinone oxidoreductase chain 3 n=1 Tax=Diolcogaster sp. SNS-2016 TaxID=1911508 RepID=A0A6F8AL04_9HYME|nr:NADH dehydrogenase subunit 3 [Diolcogaster sp. SNS-2016]
MIFLMNFIMFFMLMIMMIILLINWFFSKKKMKIFQKNSPFEWGFEPFESSRLPFSIQFYLIGVLFLIFDIEIIIMLPIMNSLKTLNYLSWIYSSMMILIILYLGLEFEKNEGILKWFL